MYHTYIYIYVVALGFILGPCFTTASQCICIPELLNVAHSPYRWYHQQLPRRTSGLSMLYISTNSTLYISSDCCKQKLSRNLKYLILFSETAFSVFHLFLYIPLSLFLSPLFSASFHSLTNCLSPFHPLYLYMYVCMYFQTLRRFICFYISSCSSFTFFNSWHT